MITDTSSTHKMLVAGPRDLYVRNIWEILGVAMSRALITIGVMVLVVGLAWYLWWETQILRVVCLVRDRSGFENLTRRWLKGPGYCPIVGNPSCASSKISAYWIIDEKCAPELRQINNYQNRQVLSIPVAALGATLVAMSPFQRRGAPAGSKRLV